MKKRMLGLWLLLLVSTALAEFPDWHAANLRWVAAGADTHYYRSTSGSTLSWGETYNLQTYNLMFRVDGDTLWLGKLAKHGLAIKNSARDIPENATNWDSLYRDGFRGWGDSTYTGDYDEYLVWDGHICAEIARFVRVVYDAPEQFPQYLPAADTLLQFLEKHVAGKWYSIWYTPRVTPPGELATNDTYHKWIGGQNLQYIPANRFAAFGSFLLELTRITQNPRYVSPDPAQTAWYPQVVQEIAQEMKSWLNYDNWLDLYFWGYAFGGDNNDVSHSAIEVAFMIECAENGVVFTRQDLQRLAHTLTRRLWQNPPDLEPALLWDYFDQSDRSSGSYDRYLRKWGLLGLYDPLAGAVTSGVLRDFARTGNYSSGVYAAGIAAMALFNQKTLPAAIAGKPVFRERSGDGDNTPDPGEEVEMRLPVANWGFRVLDSLVVEIEANDRITLTTNRVAYPPVASVDTVLNEIPFVFTVKPAETGGVVPLKIKLQSGEKVQIDSAKITCGPMSILLIDDDGGAALESFYENGVLDSLGLHQHWDVQQNGSPTPYLAEFGKVIWFTGDEMDSTLTPGDRAALADYLDSGGKLLLFSAGLQTDILDSSAPDSVFFRNYLHAESSDKQITSRWITTIRIDETFFPGKFLVIYPQENTTFRAISASTGANPLFRYPFGDAAIFFNGNHRVAYFTFGLENVNKGETEREKASDRRFLLRQLFAALDFPTRVTGTTKPPVSFQVRIYPNPAPDQVAIHVQGSASPRLEFTIFNELGQVVRKASQNGGQPSQRWLWDGQNAAGSPVGSGIYFVRVSDGREVQTQKILRIR